MIGAFSVGDRNDEGGRVIDYSMLNGLSVMNTGESPIPKQIVPPVTWL